MFLNTSQASPAPEWYQISNTSPAPEKYLNTLLRRRRCLGSIGKHLSGAGEVFIHTFPAPEKCLYTLFWRRRGRRSRRSIYIHRNQDAILHDIRCEHGRRVRGTGGKVPLQNLRWGTSHASVPPIFREVELLDAWQSAN